MHTYLLFDVSIYIYTHTYTHVYMNTDVVRCVFTCLLPCFPLAASMGSCMRACRKGATSPQSCRLVISLTNAKSWLRTGASKFPLGSKGLRSRAWSAGLRPLDAVLKQGIRDRRGARHRSTSLRLRPAESA